MSDDEKAYQEFRRRIKDEGVGTLNCADGRYFGFSKAKLLEFIKQLEEQNKDELIVFITSSTELLN